MKKSNLIGAMTVAVATVLGGCQETTQPAGAGSGYIRPAVELDNDVVTSRALAGSRAGDGVTVDDLTLTLTKNDGSYMHTCKVADFPYDRTFTVGEYTLRASYGKVEDEGFGKPAYSGETTLTVRDGEATEISLEASLANAMFSVEFSDAFRDYMSDYSVSLRADGGQDVVFATTETRPAYVRPGNVTVYASFTRPNGTKTDKFDIRTVVAEARHHYTLKFDVNGGNVGSGEITVTFDDMLAEEEWSVDLEGIESIPAPVLTPEEFVSGEPIDFVEGMAPGAEMSVSILAQGEIRKITLSTTEGTAPQGWPAVLDLCTPDGLAAANAAGVTAIGLNKPGKMAVVDLSRLPAMLSGATTIEIAATDRNGKTCETPLQLVLRPEPLALTFSLPEGVKGFVPGTEMSLDMAFNGDPATVGLQYLNAAGGWTALPATVAAASRAMHNYTVTFTAPDIDFDLTVRAVVGQRVLSETEFTIPDAPFSIAVSDNDVFARYAYVTVGGKNGAAAPAISELKFLASTDGGSTYSEVAPGADGKLALEPATSYILTAEAYGLRCRPAKFTSEEAAALPHGDLDENGSGSQHNEKTIAGWGTNNPMTTSQGLNQDYCRYSGTVGTSDTRDGNGNAVLLRSIGWGEGNAIWLGSIERSTIKYLDCGLLHLGADRNARTSGALTSTADLDCGIAFGSRPKEMSFWYKYSPKNSSDKGLAEITVLDASGNVVASKVEYLEKATEYTRHSIALDYPRGSAKATKVYVRFQSTYSDDFLAKTSSNFTYKMASAVIGSQLYVDDIELIY